MFHCHCHHFMILKSVGYHTFAYLPCYYRWWESGKYVWVGSTSTAKFNGIRLCGWETERGGKGNASFEACLLIIIWANDKCCIINTWAVWVEHSTVVSMIELHLCVHKFLLCPQWNILPSLVNRDHAISNEYGLWEQFDEIYHPRALTNCAHKTLYLYMSSGSIIDTAWHWADLHFAQLFVLSKWINCMDLILQTQLASQEKKTSMH